MLKFFAALCTTLLSLSTSYAQYIPKSQWQRYPALLIGTWQSLQDPKSFLVITKTKYQDVYEQEKISASTYTITNDCPDPNLTKHPDAAKTILVTYDATMPDEPFCYGIDLLTNTRLTLIYMGRGNSLRFKRVAQRPPAPRHP